MTRTDRSAPWYARALREPLLHFVVLGAALFAVHARVQRRAVPAGRAVSLAAADVRGLRAELERRSGVPPPTSAVRARVQQWIDDEVLYREALRLGLDRGDEVVRRRLVQKMSLLLRPAAPAAAPPDDATLARFLAAHPERYTLPPRASYTQVYFAARRSTAAEDATAALAVLRAGADPATLGDPFPLGAVALRRPLPQVAAELGRPFATALASAPPGVWTGPLSTRYGQHLVRVDALEPPGPPPLQDVRALLRADWAADRRAAADRDALAALRARYTVRVDWPAELRESR